MSLISLPGQQVRLRPIVLFALFVVFTTPLYAGDQEYSFYSKAKSYYRTDIKSAPGKPENEIIDPEFVNPADSTVFDKAYTASWKIALLLLEKGNHAKALDILNDMRQYFETKSSKTKKDQQRISSLYNVIGAIYEETGLWNDAMAMYMNSLQVCYSIDNKAGEAKVFNNLGKLYYGRNELDKAEELFNKAVTINKKLDIRPELFNNYNNLAGVYNRRHDLAKALEYALIAMNQLDINRDFFDLSISYANIGNLYQNMDNLQVALSYYRQAAAIQDQKSFQIALLNSFLSISSLFESMHLQDSAKFYINKSLNLCELLNNPAEKLAVYREAAKYYAGNGNFQKAYDFYSKVILLNDSLETLNSLTKIEQIQAVYEVINKEKDNKILQQKINLQQLAIQRQRIVLIGAVAIVLFFIIFVFSLIRNNRREREKNRMIIKQAELLHQQEKSMLLNKERSLELELDYKNRQLTSYALHLARNNEFVFKTTEELKKILLRLGPKDKECAERIKQVILELHQSTSGSGWEEFRLYFEEVHQSFEKNLTTAFPDLSPNDKKICALLKLGLNTKEIASITFRELRSVESARNRLRKKMGLSVDVNINNFLSRF